jgi:SOS-response transcriptional repressor LexA
MNKCQVNGKTIDNGSYVLIKKDETNLNEKDPFLFIVDGGATLKRYKKNASQIYLIPESSENHHTPIILSEYDNISSNGKVVDVFTF